MLPAVGRRWWKPCQPYLGEDGLIGPQAKSKEPEGVLTRGIALEYLTAFNAGWQALRQRDGPGDKGSALFEDFGRFGKESQSSWSELAERSRRPSVEVQPRTRASRPS